MGKEKPRLRNEPCPCGSGKKRKKCHGVAHSNLEAGGRPARADAFDWAASWLEARVKPHLLRTRRSAMHTWASTFDEWLGSEATANGYDTQRLERLADRAWQRCCDALQGWDSRFAFPLLRSLPIEVIAHVAQIALAPQEIWRVMHIMTAASLQDGRTTWREGLKETGLDLPLQELAQVEAHAPEIIGRCVGAAALVASAQIWYRLAGKGLKLAPVAARIEQVHLDVIGRWDGVGVCLLPTVQFLAAPEIEKAIAVYETRKWTSISSWTISGLVRRDADEARVGSVHRMWYAAVLDRSQPPIPVQVPALRRTFPSPNFVPLPDLALSSFVAGLRPFEARLQSKLGLSCDELLFGLSALGCMIERNTHCQFMSERSGGLVLDSRADKSILYKATRRLVSILLRGALRGSMRSFREGLVVDLERLGCRAPKHLAERFMNAFTGVPNHQELPRPLLFYVLSPVTCVLELSQWNAFRDACLALATSGDGDVGNVRAGLFEEQVRDLLRCRLCIEVEEVPWVPNRDVVEGGINYGDVDYCFLRHGILFNLDMKSWQRSSGYYVGHYHVIANRLRNLDDQMSKVERRGHQLCTQLKKIGHDIEACLSLLIVAAPEYLSPDHPSLWYGDHPRVLTVEELVALVQDPEALRVVVQTSLR